MSSSRMSNSRMSSSNWMIREQVILNWVWNIERVHRPTIRSTTLWIWKTNMVINKGIRNDRLC